MALDRPNVVFLSVDALRADRCSLYGYDRPTTPNLERLAKRAIVCDNAYSLAAFTQGSFPSMLTSTRPLSHGGYDNGAMGRPESVFSLFHRAGWSMNVLSSFKWVSRYFGYGQDFDREEHLYSPKGLMGTAVNRTKSSIINWRNGRLSNDEMLSLITQVFEKLFHDLNDYCENKLRTIDFDQVDFSNTHLILDGFDYPAIQRNVAGHRERFRADPMAYVDRYFTKIPEAHEWMAADWRLCRKPARLVGEALHRVTNKMLAAVSPSRAVLRQNRIKQFVDGHALANRVIRVIREQQNSKPFFVWTHFLDTHVPYLPGQGQSWYRHAHHYLEALGYGRSIDLAIAPHKRPLHPDHRPAWSALYDAALRYVDEQIGRILDAIDASDHADNTLVVVCGDHGEELGEHGNYSHYFRLHRHNTWVPMVFSHPGLEPQRVPTMTSLLDLAPTLADLAGIDPAEGWEGRPVTSPEAAARRHLVLETFYGGNCLFALRPLYMAVRTPNHGFLWKEHMDPEDKFGPEGNELYDVTTDPLEQNNLFRPDHPLVREFLPLIAQRLSQIPEIAPERWQALLTPLEESAP
ncbi:sulfatase-like hydrolase/transferase [Magnetospirillum sulfuroxidans]|uniref:Sulfatase-like hydrolase/transferase n=1 Tax=Magnetospirillum sulfuroxidans TaxID=611300 RepID=A0ABS5IIY3_9PROT|nr:sulfatase-like hydrolase/transferase [Magnetospirillum sulfuroxidans]MBR9973748.1 sulfatase-like hydrolase/transferase [Magnetospirillum sulfuroxidans]